MVYLHHWRTTLVSLSFVTCYMKGERMSTFTNGRQTVNTVIHTTLVGLEPTTLRLLVRRATSSATEPTRGIFSLIWCWPAGHLERKCRNRSSQRAQKLSVAYPLLKFVCQTDSKYTLLHITLLHDCQKLWVVAEIFG